MTSLSARYQQRPYRYDDDDGLEKQQIDRPTQTRTDLLGPRIVPDKPKIVVLGASGRIGRLVVQQLLDNPHLDATIVAFVRNYDKACDVLYKNDDLAVLQKRNKGPTLQIVQGDLVPPEELPGYRDDDEEEQSWLERASSASSFYKNSKITDYDNRHYLPSPNEALEDALRGCTTIISCVGSVRPTHIWSDWIARPFWRVLRKDVSGWCRDARHPFYVHYAATRKILGFAEREQLRREAAAAAAAEEKEKETVNKKNKNQVNIPRIRFVRISDLCVAHRPWDFVPLLTNVIQSIVFRYQEMAERLLEESTVIDTIVLRPGDLVDEERDTQTTHLQVDPSGVVPTPALVSREDVAALAVSAALYKDPQEDKTLKPTTTTSPSSFHYTLAVRWVGKDMAPYPAQGRKQDGLSDASLCLQHVLKSQQKQQQGNKNNKKKNKKQQLQLQSNSPILRYQFAKLQGRKRRLQPHGICVAIPVYLALALALRTAGAYICPRLLPLIPRPIADGTRDFVAWIAATIWAVIRNSRILRQTAVWRGSAKTYVTF